MDGIEIVKWGKVIVDDSDLPTVTEFHFRGGRNMYEGGLIALREARAKIDLAIAGLERRLKH